MAEACRVALGGLLCKVATGRRRVSRGGSMEQVEDGDDGMAG